MLQVNELSSTLTPEQLAEYLLGNSMQISNVKFIGSNNAAGTFSGGTGIFGFENGVILSTGSIKSIIGSNSASNVSTVNGKSGDSDLDSLISGTTYDAAVLEFDFIPATKEITFKYQFTSEEYNEYVNMGYNDTFAFFVNGQNIALIPDTTTLISTDNINQNKNSTYYINNDISINSPLNTTMDGMTVALTAKAEVKPFETNHIKLAIADTADYSIDSNVLIEAGNFLLDTIPPALMIPENVTTNATGIKTLIDIGTATATDNLSQSKDIIITNNAPEYGFPVGTTVVTWTATDQCGNSSSGVQNVTVNDIEPPVLRVPADVKVNAINIRTPIDIGTATATDNASLPAEIKITNNAPADAFPIGTTVVTWTATDPSGNSSLGTQNVTVRPTIQVILIIIINFLKEIIKKLL